MVIHNRIKDFLSKNAMIPLLKIRRRVNTHLPAPSAIFPLSPKDVYNGENISYHIHWILTYLFSSDLIFPLFWSVLSWSLWLSLDISSSLEMHNHFIYIENKTIKNTSKNSNNHYDSLCLKIQYFFCFMFQALRQPVLLRCEAFDVFKSAKGQAKCSCDKNLEIPHFSSNITV